MNILKTNVSVLPLKYLHENKGQIEGVPANPRVLKDDKYRALLESLRKDDLTGVLPLKIYKHGDEFIVLGGNMRLKALRELKGNDYAVSCVEIPEGTPVEVLRKIVVLDNSTFGEWDFDMLANEWDSDELKEWSVDVPTFEEKDEELTAQEDDFDEEKDKVETVCKKGDIWLLGQHRLMCGDSTDADAVGRLMQGERASLVFTDPPYGMKKESAGVLNDNLNYDDLLEFNKQWIPLTFQHLKDNGSWYCWGIDEPLMDIYSNILKPMMRRKEITFRNLITWFKNPSGCGDGQNNSTARSYGIITEKCLFVMCGKEDYNINTDNYYEGWESVRTYLESEAQKVGLDAKTLKDICGVGMYAHWFTKSQWTFITEPHYNKLQDHFEGKAFGRSYADLQKEFETAKAEFERIKQKWYATRAYFDNTHDLMTEVWQFDRVTTAERKELGHQTPKPIPLCCRGIKSSSRDGEIVLDVFGGSGSTLIACEQLGRKCYMMELDPHYCDVIIARWEKLTGQKATKTK